MILCANHLVVQDIDVTFLYSWLAGLPRSSCMNAPPNSNGRQKT